MLQVRKRKDFCESHVDPGATTMEEFIRIASASAARIDKQRAAAAKAQEARAIEASTAEPSGAPGLPAPSGGSSSGASGAVVPAPVDPGVPQLILQDGNIVVNPASLQVRVSFQQLLA
jgi:hypothetical protein